MTRHSEALAPVRKDEHTPGGELQRRIDQLSALNKVAAAISQSLDLEATLQTAMDAVLSVIPVEASGISLIDESAGELVLRAQRGWKQDFVSKPMRIRLGHGMSGQVIRTGEVVITGDVRNDPRLYVPEVANENIKAMALAPMHARGKIIGVLSVISYQPYTFDDQEIDVLKAVADQVGVALDNASLYEATREAQERLLTVLQSTADAIIATDSRMHVSLVNRTAEDWFAFAGPAYLDRPLTDVPFPDAICDALQNAIAAFDGHPQRFEVALDEKRFLAAVLSPVSVLPEGIDQTQTNGWVAVFQDITHIREAERARMQFVQTAAHDLRNPLGATLSALTMLHKGWQNPTATETEIFEIAMRGMTRMQDLIDDLLNLEKLDSGLDFSTEPLDIRDLIERTALDMRPVLKQHEQALHIEIAADLPPVSGNAHWLVRALMNLISNAQKYGREGGTVTVRATCADGREVLLDVSDDGPGIPLDAQPRLFDRFYRVPQMKDKAHGTGLGLAIVKSIMERHGGRVAVESAPGEGATFSLILPVQPVR